MWRALASAALTLAIASCGRLSYDPVPQGDGGADDADARCAAGERVVSGTCAACPAGSTNAAGDDPAGPDTRCDPTLCRADQRVLTNACAACPAGSTNTAGDDASGPDTTCDGALCASNQRVLANACTPCPAGSTNVAGDDPAGPDTTCDDACSAVFGLTCDRFEEGYLKASNTDADDNFGYSVALSGDTLAVGAYVEDSAARGVSGDQTSNAATNSGAVYVFVRSGTTWIQQAYLKASNTEASDNFGSSVALSGDTLAIGAFGEDSAATGVGGDQASNAAADSGAVYVFVRSGTTWTQQAYLKASNTGGADFFGISVGLSGDTLIVGARLEDSASTGVGGDQTSNAAVDSGAVFVRRITP